MIIPKTNWKAADYFNVTDYTRITANLNDAAVAVGVATKTYETASYATLLMLTTRNNIASHANSIAAACEWDITISITKSAWFDWKELNTIEQVCADAVAETVYAAYGQGNAYGDGLYYGGGTID